MTLQAIHHFVQGQRFAGSSARQQDVFNPATGAVTGQVALGNAADVQAAVNVYYRSILIDVNTAAKL